MTKCRPKVTRNRAVLVMPTSVIYSQLVLIVRLICHDEKSARKLYFAKQVKVQVQLYTVEGDRGAGAGENKGREGYGRREKKGREAGSL